MREIGAFAVISTRAGKIPDLGFAGGSRILTKNIQLWLFETYILVPNG